MLYITSPNFPQKQLHVAVYFEGSITDLVKAMQQENTHSGSAEELTTRTLSGDIILAIAKHVREIKATVRLSGTCRFYHGLLDPFIYRADMLRAKRSYLQSRQVVGRRTVAEKIALHWAIAQADDRTRMTVAQKSIKAALKYWPECFEVTDWDGARMTPLHLAAKHGVEDIVRELTEAYGPVDMEVKVKSNPNFTLRTYKLAEPRRFTVIPLSAAIIYGHVGVAETLARLTGELEECETKRGILSPLRLAALHKMPSVIKILQSRGFKVGAHRGLVYDKGLTSLHFAAAEDNNEETLQLLLDTGYSLDYVNHGGWTAFETTLEFRCLANAVFLVKDLSMGEKLNIANHNFGRLLKTDVFLPVTKALLEGTKIHRKQARRHKSAMRRVIKKIRGLEEAQKTMNFLMTHPSINFPKNMHERLAEMTNKAIEYQKAREKFLEDLRAPQYRWHRGGG
ncbi:ankyrin [Daldinia caldariorum]|uniref:ankyrin n=1 Tax=Daldinia caldariorum TaxID=326644 RepID=UPI0020071F4B|nr:ankyrin [Daldinia caldariorum]KAI1471107.1 ankyrin [Daldinia caldariorum]